MTANKLEGKARELLAEELGPNPRYPLDPIVVMDAAVRAIIRALDTARQSEGMVVVPRAATIGIRGVLYRTRSGYGDDYMTPEQADALWAELLAAAPADAGEG